MLEKNFTMNEPEFIISLILPHGDSNPGLPFNPKKK